MDEIEKLTGIDFLTELPHASETAIEKDQAKQLWPVQDADFIRACHSN